LPAAPRVLDLGCGSGRAALMLAETLRTKVIGVDIHRPFLDQLQGAARERNLEDLLEVWPADQTRQSSNCSRRATPSSTS
jgi:cyclopropane fatty-acyl-phospholipid synthase-like methyltransferase